jgi:hypothetical protein
VKRPRGRPPGSGKRARDETADDTAALEPPHKRPRSSEPVICHYCAGKSIKGSKCMRIHRKTRKHEENVRRAGAERLEELLQEERIIQGSKNKQVPDVLKKQIALERIRLANRALPPTAAIVEEGGASSSSDSSDESSSSSPSPSSSSSVSNTDA